MNLVVSAAIETKRDGFSVPADLFKFVEKDDLRGIKEVLSEMDKFDRQFASEMLDLYLKDLEFINSAQSTRDIYIRKEVMRAHKEVALRMLSNHGKNCDIYNINASSDIASPCLLDLRKSLLAVEDKAIMVAYLEVSLSQVLTVQNPRLADPKFSAEFSAQIVSALRSDISLVSFNDKYSSAEICYLNKLSNGSEIEVGLALKSVLGYIISYRENYSLKEAKIVGELRRREDGTRTMKRGD